MDRLGEVGRKADAVVASQQPPAPLPAPNVSASASFGVVTHLDFETVNDYVIFDDTRFSRGGRPFKIGRHPAANLPGSEWDYALIAPGTDDVSFLIEFLVPVRGWTIHGSCYQTVNGVPTPAHPYAWTYFENDGTWGPIKDTATYPIIAPQVHNKEAHSLDAEGYPSGRCVRVEMNVWLPGTGAGPPNFQGAERLNGFIGGGMAWER
jgi:hypothetical protein